MDDEQRNKAHKSKTTGNKAQKRDEFRKKKAGIDLQPNRGTNIKAFQGPSATGRKAQKFFRSVEKRETALHVPTMDKTLRHLVTEPPLLVAVVGPPGVGKTTLIRSLVKFYSNRNLQTVRGPITVVAGRARRITFLECPNTLTAMCDVAKVADLVLLMVDGSYGFEMETFEFLSIAQIHGFPKVFGILSHLDSLKTGKALKKRKRFLRHRFWHEVAAGAKLLCLSPMVRGMYRQSDVLNLHRLLICVEPKIQAWRNTHSCILIDRQEDVTDPDHVAQDPNCERSIAFYGFARGRPMKPGQLVHIPGLGDFPVEHISRQPDPCETAGGLNPGKSQGHRMRHLSAKQKQLYAPYCDVGGISYDEDAIYLDEDGERAMIERSGEGLRLLRELQQARPIDAEGTELALVDGAAGSAAAAAPRQRRPVVFKNEDTMELEIGNVERPSSDDDDDADDSAEDEADSLYSDDLTQPAGTGKQPTLDQFGLSTEEEGEMNEAEETDASGAPALAPRHPYDTDSICLRVPRHDWAGEAALLKSLKDLCVTGNWERASDEEGDSDAEDDAHSKGYDSNDDDFDAQVRGEKPVVRRDKTRAGDKHDEDDDEDEEENAHSQSSGEEGESGEEDGHDALAKVSYGQRFGSVVAGDVTKKHGWKRKHAAAGDSGDAADYDLLNEIEEEEGQGNAGSSGNGITMDAELDGLVNSFLVRGSGQRRVGVSSSSSATAAAPRSLAGADGLVNDEEEGIAFYNPHKPSAARGATSRQHRRHGEEDDDDDEDEEALLDQAVQNGDALTEAQEAVLKKRMEKKQAFDEDYDAGGDGGKTMTYKYYNELKRQVEEKKEKLDEALDDVGEDIDKRIQLVGYFSGLYVRFVISNIPVEFLKTFRPEVPLVAGGVNAGEDEYRVVHARIKRHRWFPRILKAQDPVLISMGWRRFQTQPIYATEDPNGRHRYLKYTPMHMHCLAAFYAPVAPTNTGFLAIPVRDEKSSFFRVPCTGYTIGNDVSASVVKKLKLTGVPAKVEKTSVFLRGLFNSDLEAAKFVGAKLKSVSGIRGIIKSVLKGKQGMVRATFEDKIFPSDIVFIRAWKSVEPPRYCSIQRNLLDPNWVGMRTMRELRWDYGVRNEQHPDSQYREIKRRHRVAEEGEDFNKQRVLVSRSTKMQLPFNMKEEFIPLAKTTALQERIKGAVTVAPEVREQRRQALLDTFEDRADAMTRKKNEAKKRARERTEKLAAKEEEKYAQGLKKAKKETARMREFRSQHKSRS